MSSRAGSNQGPWQIKRVNSVTGFSGTALAYALISKKSVTGTKQIKSIIGIN